MSVWSSADIIKQLLIPRNITCAFRVLSEETPAGKPAGSEGVFLLVALQGGVIFSRHNRKSRFRVHVAMGCIGGVSISSGVYVYSTFLILKKRHSQSAEERATVGRFHHFQ